MLNWNEYWKEFLMCIGDIVKLLFDMLVGYKVLFGVGVKMGYFDVKMCELIVFVVVVMICCDGCIVVYMVEVVKYGVIKEEVVEVFGVVIVLNVGVVFVYLVWVMDVFGD